MVGPNTETQTTSPETPKYPSPQDLPVFLPWACNRLQYQYTIAVNKEFTYNVPGTQKLRNKSKNKDVGNSMTEVISGTLKSLVNVPSDYPVVKITAVYSNENLIQIKFEKNKRIPRSALQLIALTLKFHQQLQYISVNSGLDSVCIYEISKFLLLSNITDVCLDGSFVREANYYVLLEKPNSLKQLSLSKCTINDNVVETIAANLVYPLPASKTLSILNLSCNRITNVGAKYLAQALRSNRQVCYLNLASNMIDDEGFEGILSMLMEFPISKEEALDAKRRLMKYLKKKREVINKTIDALKTVDVKKRSKKTVPKKGKVNEEPTSNLNTYVEDSDDYYYAEAESIALNTIGDFTDPFKTTVHKDDQIYCSGNNGLAYLNIAYNNISYRSLDKLLTVLKHQKSLERRPKGLVNVCIEGNPLPKECSELTQINTIFDIGLRGVDRRPSILKKRAPLKKP